MAGQDKGGTGTRTSTGGRAAGTRSQGTRRVSPAVYRRRRLAVLVLMVLILGVLGVGIWTAVVAVGSVAQSPAPLSTAALGSGSDPSSKATSTAGADPSASSAASAAGASADPTATPTATPTPACDQHLITVSASTDKPSYAPTEKPVFTLKVTNGNPMPCEVNVGTTQMEFLVVSGTDRVFSSKDCQASAQDLPKTIAAGASETANFPWDRVRSTEGCKAVTTQPKPGIYVMTASLGPVTSSKAVFELK
ncbi:hypothetical protein RBS60_18785 [Sinomonas sp. ASV486]|uniref:hypothetical protein n=1 Tax=Sinomonas sp. ASV486 TaxID=3051170 RepID=UPI0027DD6B13|nr:hypothetical protein [Sinomonas sp. ASV486]MDQ4492251.1 hypothetical protein [Sinomonas sp. ASV486]